MRAQLDLWMQTIIKTEVDKALKKQRERWGFILLQVGAVLVVVGFGHAMWTLAHRAACG